MTFADIAPGSEVFLDANTLIYHFAPAPTLGAACTDLLVRIKKHEFKGYVSTNVLSEVAHRLMAIEAINTLGWPTTGVAQRLRNHRADVMKLTAFRKAVQEVPQFGLQVLTIAPDLIDAAAGVSQQTGLLSNDALIVALMQQRGLTKLASHDGDFDCVIGLTRFAPA
jgi:predicted nucleic acid-binding protein